jgi:hypothetical protein
MKPITLTATVALLALAWWATAGTTVRYEPPKENDEFIRRVKIETPGKPEAIDEKQRVYSPHRTRWFRADVDPGTIPYDQRTGRIHIGGPDGFARTISFSYVKTHSVRWINEELIYVEIWLGHVLATEHIFNVETGQALYQKTAVYSTKE